jgi:metal-sulfur cluster biosynthetic enzyme
MTVTSDQVVESLAAVIDPCSLSMGGRRDIRAMGLVDTVDIRGGRVRVELVLTDPACVFWSGIKQNVVDVVGALPGVDEVEVAVSRTATWTPRRMRASSVPAAREISPAHAR